MLCLIPGSLLPALKSSSLMLGHPPGIITWQLLRPSSTASEKSERHNVGLKWYSCVFAPCKTQVTVHLRLTRCCTVISASPPVSPWATVMSDDVLLSIAEPSAESSIPTCPVLHFWIIAYRWLEKNYKCVNLFTNCNNISKNRTKFKWLNGDESC